MFFLKMLATTPRDFSQTLGDVLKKLSEREAHLLAGIYPDIAEAERPNLLKNGLALFENLTASPTEMAPHVALHTLLNQQKAIEKSRIGYSDAFKSYSHDAVAIWFYYRANSILTHDDMSCIVRHYQQSPLRKEDVLWFKRILVEANFRDESDPDVGVDEHADRVYREFKEGVGSGPFSPFRALVLEYLKNSQVVHAVQVAGNSGAFLEETPSGEWCLKKLPLAEIFGPPEQSDPFLVQLPVDVQALYREAGTLSQLYSPKFWRDKGNEAQAQQLEALGLCDSLDYGALIATLFEHDDGKGLGPLNGLPQFVVVGDSRPTELGYQHEMDVPLSDSAMKPGQMIEGTPKKGLSQFTMTGFHDYYMSYVYEKNPGTTPPGLGYLVRYHSAYMYHHHLKLAEFADSTDWLMLPLLRLFQQCDLYSKTKPTAKDLATLFEFSLKIESAYRGVHKLPEGADVMTLRMNFPVTVTG